MSFNIKEEAIAEVMEEEVVESHRFLALKVSIGIVLALIVGGLIWWFSQSQWVTMKVADNSMYPTLRKDEFALTHNDKKRDYKQSDVVVVKTPSSNEKKVKRILALADQTVEWTNDKLTVDGAEITQTEPENVAAQETADYKAGMDRSPQKILVPKGKVFVMGDNWRISFDSFDYGPIDIKDLQGVVRYVYWPFGDRREIR
ncbi:MAG: signal peptidase I [Candidatus Sumerlaeota bacterium]|nr:signal peptidase I [Candidatus Sumerlaeota bacterium]